MWTLFSVTDAVRWYYAPLLNDAEANIWLKNMSEGFGAGLYLLFALLFVQSNLSWNACARPLCASAVWTAAVSALWIYHDKLSSEDDLRGVLALCAAAATTLLYMLLLTPPFACRRAGRVFVAYQLSISSVLVVFNAVLVSQRSTEAFPSLEARLSTIYTRYLLPTWFALLPLAMYAVLYMDTMYWRGVIDDAFNPHGRGHEAPPCERPCPGPAPRPLPRAQHAESARGRMCSRPPHHRPRLCRNASGAHTRTFARADMEARARSVARTHILGRARAGEHSARMCAKARAHGRTCAHVEAAVVSLDVEAYGLVHGLLDRQKPLLIHWNLLRIGALIGRSQNPVIAHPPADPLNQLIRAAQRGGARQQPRAQCRLRTSAGACRFTRQCGETRMSASL
jgi:hypothetical protein